MDRDGRRHSDTPRPGVLLPGSFNPVHAGHWRLAATARRRLGQSVAYELSAANVDKAPLSLGEIRCRLAQFVWKAPVYLTRAPRSIETAVLFSGVVIAAGDDT